jgi:excisionase family DNA binding protein
MRQTRTSRSRTSRTSRHKSRTSERQTVQTVAANVAASRPTAGDMPLTVAQAARLLGADPRTVRRFIASGELPAYQTPGGQYRIPAAGVDAIRQGRSAAPAPTSVAANSFPNAAAASKSRVEQLNAEIAERRASKVLKQLDDEEQAEKDAVEAEAAEQRRRDDEARIEREQRQQEQRNARREARIRADWEAEKLEIAIGTLPRDIPNEIVFEVTQAVRQKLPELYSGTPEDVVDRCVMGIAVSLSRPWIRSKKAEAIAAAIVPKTFNCLTPDDWRARAKENAIAAIVRLPDAASEQSMVLAATAAVRQTDTEYRHSQVLDWALEGVRCRLLPRVLAHSSAESRAAAEDAVRTVFERLPIGASQAAFDTARDTALAPFLAAESQLKAAHDAGAAKASMESQADLHLYRVEAYLAQLETRADGWDFEVGERSKYAARIRQEIRPTLIEKLPLDLTAGRKLVESLVDEWLAEHA